MGGLLLLVAVGFVSAACPRGIKKAVFIPHERDASRYYLCETEFEELLSCTKGLVFDANSQKCTSGKVAFKKNLNEHSIENSRQNDDNSGENSSPNSVEANNSRNDSSRENSRENNNSRESSRENNKTN